MGSYLEYAKKKRKGEEEEENSSSSGADSGYAKFAAEKRIGLDTFESDLADMGNKINSIYSGWQTPETMANTRVAVESMQKRVNDYATYQKKYAPDNAFDADSLLKGYQTVLNDWDKLAETYSTFKDAESYKNYPNYQKSLEEDKKKKEENVKALDNAFDQYKDYLSKEDYAEMSQYKSSAKRDGFWKAIGMDGSDETYEFINDVDGARNMLIAKYKEGNGATELEQHGYQYMTDEEKGVYNYKYAVEGKESADQYLKDLEISLNKRVYDDSTATWGKWADNPLGAVGLSAVSPIMSMAGGIGSAIESFNELKNGEKYNPYAPGRVASNATSDIRGYVGENIAELTEGVEVFGQNPFQQAYGALMSGADSFLMANALGPLGLKEAISPIMAMNSYQQTAKEQTEAGEDPETVQAMAITSGAIEYITEKMGIDNFFKLKNPDSITSLLKNMRNQAGSEAFEEALSELGNTIAEDVIKGEDSKLYSKYNDLIARGYSKKEALWESAKEFGANMFWAAAGGALSGGVLGGIDGSIRHNDLKQKGAEIRSNDRVSEMLDVAGDAFMSLSEKDAYKAYTEYAKKGITAENINDAQLGSLYTSVAQNIEDVSHSKKATPQEQNDIKRQKEGLAKVDDYRPDSERIKEARTNSLDKGEVTEVSATGNSAKIEGYRFEDGEMVVKTSEGEFKTSEMTFSQNDAEALAYAENLGEEKGSIFVAQYDGQTDVDSYAKSFDLMHSYGETGFGTDYALQNKGVLTDAQAIAIYKEGAASKARESSDAFRYTVDEIVGEGMSIEKFDDSIIDYDGTGEGSVKLNSLTRSEREQLGFAKLFASGLNYANLEVIESKVENGRYVGENGSWNPNTRTIYIDVHAGRNRLTDSNSYIVSTLSHEITHSFEGAASEEYAELSNHVLNYLSSHEGKDVPTLIQMKRDKLLSSQTYKKNGITDLADDIVIKEIVADACEEMLINSKKVDEMLNGLDENTKKSFIGKVKETFENILSAIKAAIKKLDPRTREAKALRESQADFEKALELWDKAFVKANESHAESISTDTEINNALNEIGLEYDSETETVFSLRSLEEAFNYNDADGYLRAREEYINALVKATGRTKAEAERYLNSLFLVHDMIARDKDRLDYEAAVNRTAWVSNSEYGGSIDFSTLCAKRRIFTGTFDAIQNALPNTVLTDKDYLEIRNLLLKKGKESPCSMCYVEGSRAKAGEYINKWLQEYLKTNPIWKPRIADFASATGLERTRIQHPEAYSAYQEAMNKLAQRKPKEASVRTDYKGEILVAFSDGSSVEIKNLNGGIRFNSFSDFEIVHTLDCMQVITDMARVGLAGQGYTKVKEFAKCFGNTGMKINLSLVAKDVDENGKLVMDEVNGMSYKDAMELRNEFSENVGTVIVCFNVDQVKAAMADDTIDYILPFHRSQWRKAQYAAMGLPTKTKDFTMFQNDRIRNPKTGRPVKLEKLKHISHYTNDITGESYEIKGNIMPNQYWDYTKSGRENAQRYLDYINDNKMTPKFDFVLEKADGKWVLPNNAIGDGYFKLLIDFKMYNNDGVGSPQLPVTPEFNMPFIEQMLEDYKGGHGSFPVAHDVVDEFVEGYKKNHPKTQYSEREIIGASGTNYGMGVYLDSNLLSGLSDQERVEMVKEFVVSELAGEHFIAYDANNDPIDIGIAKRSASFTNKNGKKKYVIRELYGKYSKSSVKQEAIVLIDELIANSAYDTSEKSRYPHGWLDNNGNNDWDYWKVYIQEKNKTVWEAILNIANTTNGEKILYDIDPIKKVEDAVKSASTTTNNILPQNGDASQEQHSDRYEDAFFDLFDSDGTLAESSAIIEEDVNRLKQRLSMGASSMSAENIKMIAKHLLQKADSRYDFDELTDDIKDIFEYISTSKDLDSNALIAKCNDVASRILADQNGENVSRDYAKMVLKEIRSEKISTTEEQLEGIKDRYGDKYNNAIIGRIPRSNNGVSLDTKWAEWSKKYPGIFDANIESKDMLTELDDIVKAMQSASEARHAFEEAVNVTSLGTEIYNQMWLRSTTDAKSDADKQKMKELNFAHRKAIDNVRSNLVDKQIESAQVVQIVNNIKAQNKRDVERARKLGKERMDKYRDRVARNAEIERIVKIALALNKWIRDGSKKNPMPEVMRKPVLKLLTAIDASSVQKLRTGKETTKDIRLDEAFRDVVDMATSIQLSNAQIDAADVDALYIDFPSGLVDEIKQLSTLVNDITKSIGDSRYVLNEMSLEQLERMSHMITTMKHIITEMNKAHTFHHERGILGFASNMYGFVINIKDKVMNNKVSDFFEYDNATPLSVFKRMGNYGVTLFKSFQDAQDTFAFNVNAILKHKNDVYEDCGITEDDVKKWRNHVREITITDMKNTTDKNNPKFMAIKMTDAQIMGLYLLNKREQARKHIYKGGIRIGDINLDGKINPIKSVKGFNIAESDVTKIISELNDKQIYVADKFSEFLNGTCSDWGNFITMKLYGMKSFREKFYYPIQIDENGKAAKPTDDDTSIYRLLNMGFTKPIEPNANNKLVVNDIFEVFGKHTSDMAKYNAFGLAITDFLKVYNYNSKIYTGHNGEHETESMQTAIENAYGNGMKHYIRTFLEDVNGTQSGGRGEEFTKKMMSNYKIAAVGANINVALLQPMSYVRAIMVLPAKYLFFRGNTLHWKKGSENALKYSGMAVWKSLGFYDTNITRGVQAQITGGESFKDKVAEKSMILAEIGDKFTWGSLWNACELEVKDRRKDLDVTSEEFYKEVALKFREVVYATQVVDSTMTRAQIMRSKSAMMQTVTAFMSESLLTYNMVADVFFEWSMENRQGHSVSVGKYGRKFIKAVGVYCATAALSSVVRATTDILRYDDDEEEDLEEFVKNFKENFKSEINPLSKLPFFKDVVSVFEGYEPTRMDEQSLVTIKRAIDAWKKVVKDDKDVDYKTVYKTLQAISQTTGTPVSNLTRDVVSMWNYFIGKAYPSLKVETK